MINLAQKEKQHTHTKNNQINPPSNQKTQAKTGKKNCKVSLETVARDGEVRSEQQHEQNNIFSCLQSSCWGKGNLAKETLYLCLSIVVTEAPFKASSLNLFAVFFFTLWGLNIKIFIFKLSNM